MNRRRSALAAVAAVAALASIGSPDTRASAAPQRRLLQIGRSRSIKSIAEAARLARDGDRIEVDAGDYAGDVALWQQDDLTLAAMGGRVRLWAQGAAAERKGIWVVRGGRVAARGFDFFGASVPDRNGAGIRLDSGWLTVRDCSFIGNEMGILTGNDPKAVLEVEDSEFAHNFRPDGHNHNLYAGHIARLSVTGSYLHHARIGHLLKSRAAVSEILYNRLTDEAGGEASYELEFPNGGIAFVIGNIVSQSADTGNWNLISFGAEGYGWASNELYLTNNTLIDRPGLGGTLLSVRPGAGAVLAVNNLLVGRGRLSAPGLARNRSNVQIDLASFEQQTDTDFRLRPDSPLVGRYSPPEIVRGTNLAPGREYRHPHGTVALAAPAHNPGAMQSLAAVRH